MPLLKSERSEGCACFSGLYIDRHVFWDWTSTTCIMRGGFFLLKSETSVMSVPLTNNQSTVLLAGGVKSAV